MRSQTFTCGKAPYLVSAAAAFCGQDVVLIVGGGTVPHIGAIAVAMPRPSLSPGGRPSASASVICALGHKDDLPARDAALRLSSVLGVTVTVTVGLHVDDAAVQDIRLFQANFTQIIGEAEAWLLSNQDNSVSDF